MKIQILDRFRPFTHEVGALLLLPTTTLSFQFFPSLIKVYDLKEQKQIDEIPLKIKAPMEDFTVFQDLEKKRLSFFGTTIDGFFRLHITPKDNQVAFSNSYQLAHATYTPPTIERLSLGNNKAQNYPHIHARCQMEEIFPLWYALGQLTPPSESTNSGTGHLLNLCEKAIASHDTLSIVPLFRNFYRAAFTDYFIPHLKDVNHQGFELPEVTKHSPLSIITKGAQVIRSLFLQQEDSNYFILPCLPPEFHCGRMHLHLPHGELLIEWTKKSLRQMIFKSTTSGPITFHFQKHLKKCRLNKVKADTLPLSFTLEPNKTYHFDCFEK